MKLCKLTSLLKRRQLCFKLNALYARPTSDLTIQTLNDIVGMDLQPVPGRKIYITRSKGSLFEDVELAARCAGGRQAESRRSGTAQP